MPGFWGGLAHAASGAVVAGEEQSLENQRQLLAQAAIRRQQEAEAEELNIKRIEALGKAAEAGLNVTPSGSSTPGDTPPDAANPAGPALNTEAGPAAVAPPTRIGTVAGMDVSVPQNLEPPAVRAKRDMITAGLEAPPQKTLPERIADYRKQGKSPEDAITAARADMGMEPIRDPVKTYQAERQYARTHPIPRTGTSTPELRAKYILVRANQLTKPVAGWQGMMKPPMDRATAERQAAAEYDRVHGVDVPDDQSDPTDDPSGDINLTDPTMPTAGTGGAGTVSQPPLARARAKQTGATDPAARAAKLRSDAAAAIAAGADSAAVMTRLQQKLAATK